MQLSVCSNCRCHILDARLKKDVDRISDLVPEWNRIVVRRKYLTGESSGSYEMQASYMRMFAYNFVSRSIK